MTIAGSSDTQTKNRNFVLTLNDPCDPPDSVTAPDLTDQVYTMGDSAASYTHPDFTVSPTICPIAYEYSVTLLNENESAIDVSGQQFSFYYDESLGDHVGRQTVTVTARTDSIYPTASTESLSAEADFTLSILEPHDDFYDVEIYEKANCNSNGWNIGLNVAQ